jgi:hypothetical protein
MGHTIAFNFERRLHALHRLPGRNGRRASNRAGINIPLDCRDGACLGERGVTQANFYEKFPPSDAAIAIGQSLRLAA